MQFLAELNEQQRRAAEATEGAVLIVAGPGTGKTKTLTARIAYLLEGGAKPAEVAALTFTNKAAREMRERLKGLLGSGARLPKICTFHALGADLLKQDGNEKQLVKPAEQQDIIRNLRQPSGFKGVSLRELTLVLSRAKTALQPPADEAVRLLLKRYETALAERDLRDFDDLLTRTYELLRSDSTMRPRYRHVLVDEFQDTSELQYELLKLLGSTGDLFAIGDPKQSIYSFRGAGAEMFGRFRTDYADAAEIALTKNYRSRPEIVRLANAVFPDSPRLVPQTTAAGSVHVLETLNEYSEAAYVLGEIEQGIGGSTMLRAGGDGRHEPRDYAVLYRTHQAGKAAQNAFAEAGVPCQVTGEGSPYEQPEVQAIIAGLRVAESPGGKSAYDLARQIAEEQGMAAEDLTQFFGSLVQFGTDVSACLQHIDDIAEQEFYDPTVNAVTLMTIHASKGLEFAQVFLIAAEEDILPKRNADNVDEEKRLFYVAATRAKESLTVLHARTRAGKPVKLSRFAVQLPESILPRAADPNLPVLEKRFQKRKAKRAQTSLF